MDWEQLFTSPWLWVGVALLCIGAAGGLFLAAHRRAPVDDLEDVARAAGVLDSRFLARHCDQPTIDRVFEAMVIYDKEYRP